MEIQCSILQKEQQLQLLQNGWLPEELEIDPDENRLFFGGVDAQSRLVALAVYHLPVMDRHSAVLEYVSVPKHCRRQKVGTQLLHLAEQKLQQLGRKRVSCEWRGSQQEIEEMAAFLQSAGFHPAMKPSYLVKYAQGQFQGSKLDELQKAEPAIWKAIVRIDDYHDPRLQQLMKKHDATGFYIEERDYRPELCRFYIEGGEIKGAACMKRRKNGDLENVKGYLSPTLRNQYAMTLLIAALIYGLKTAVTPGRKIYLKIYRSSYYKSMVELFGEGLEKYVFQEYEKEIGGF